MFKKSDTHLIYAFSVVNTCTQRYLKKSTEVVKKPTTVVIPGWQRREEALNLFAVFNDALTDGTLLYRLSN